LDGLLLLLHSNQSLLRGLLVGFTTAYNIKVLVSGYQSVDMHRIVLPLKFDGGLSISVLRNKQLFEKREVKSSHFQKVQIFQKLSQALELPTADVCLSYLSKIQNEFIFRSMER
jgi:hypothetical protein